jgi:putative Mg2+ transporter-C (MgtC) family protein
MAPELGFDEAVVRIILVLVLAGAVGFERELHEQEAGLRTHMLVGAGAALFVIAGNYAWDDLSFGSEAGVVLDPSRVVAYVVTGVGFLGAGTILKNNGSIRGLTTAASLWVVAAIGVVVGAGEYWLGIFATAVVLVSLWPIRLVAKEIGLRSDRTKRLRLVLDSEMRLGDIVGVVEDEGVEVQSTKVDEQDDARNLELVVVGRSGDVVQVLDRLSQAAGVRSASLAS